MRGRAIWGVALAGVLLAGACSGDDGDDGGETSSGDTSATTTTAAPDEGRYRDIVETLASDDLEGRDNQTPGSEMAQEYLSGVLEDIGVEPLPGADGYATPIEGGTNLLGVIPGGDLAD